MIYKGRKVFIDNGYPAIYMPEPQLSKVNGTIRIHVLVMEDILGRYLKDKEQVHHKDYNKLNYDKSNLMCFKTNSDHIAYHKGASAILLDDGTYICNKLPLGTGICTDCGKAITKYSIRCRSCSIKLQMSGISKCPSREVLIEDLQCFNFSKIGRKYGVTDNAVRKWCIKYSIPTNISELNQFINTYSIENN